MLPQLRELEMRYPDVLAVIGVHSGKFIAERETPRILDASLRLDALHPTVNDRQFRVWRSYAVRAWPTIVLIDARGRVVGQHAGEFTVEQLAPFLDRTIAAARAAGEIDTSVPIPFSHGKPTHEPGVLCFPSKVTVDGDRIAIADTGHHRVLIGRLAPDGVHMHVERIAGSGVPAMEDGVPGAFDMPHGLVFAGDTLYVADSRSHAVRAIDLTDGRVRTIAGTGVQPRTREDLARGAIASPWDITLAGGTLFVAAAGSHQIYAVDPTTGATRVHAGTRAEAIEDGPLLQAALAQPMGITTDGTGSLFFADAETSAVRRCSVSPDGRVDTIVGTGLFDFGDRDGVGETVRLQHDEGVAWHGDGRLLVADSYNDALKWVDPRTREARTWLRGFHEPAGVACGERFAYVADTNAHQIRVANYTTDAITTLELDGLGRA